MRQQGYIVPIVQRRLAYVVLAVGLDRRDAVGADERRAAPLGQSVRPSQTGQLSIDGRPRLTLGQPLGLIGFDGARRDLGRAEVAQLGRQGGDPVLERSARAVPGDRIVGGHELQKVSDRHALGARADVLTLSELLHPLPEMGNGFLLAFGAGTLAMLDATLPKLDGPPHASAVDAAKARDADAGGLDRRQRGELVHRDLRVGCVATVRVHSLAILTRCSGSPAEESPVRLRNVRGGRGGLSIKCMEP